MQKQPGARTNFVSSNHSSKTCIPNFFISVGNSPSSVYRCFYLLCIDGPPAPFEKIADPPRHLRRRFFVTAEEDCRFLRSTLLLRSFSTSLDRKQSSLRRHLLCSEFSAETQFSDFRLHFRIFLWRSSPSLHQPRCCRACCRMEGR